MSEIYKCHRIFQTINSAQSEVHLIERVKYIGVTFDKRLNFKTYPAEVITKVGCLTSPLYHLIDQSLNCVNKRIKYMAIVRRLTVYMEDAACDVKCLW